jgi:predicted transcriptional regulator
LPGHKAARKNIDPLRKPDDPEEREQGAAILPRFPPLPAPGIRQGGQVASANGKDAEQLVKDTVARMLDNQARFIAGVQRGIAQADRGEFIEHKDVLNRIDRLFHP